MILPLLTGLSLAVADIAGAATSAPSLPLLVVALNVNEHGRASECRIVTSSGHSLFDEHACGLILRRYEVSSRLLNGVPTSYAATVSLHWADEDSSAQ